jgi:hypothetical protein
MMGSFLVVMLVALFPSMLAVAWLVWRSGVSLMG